ncbi:MAG: NAD(P)H-dependent flavin oxidoreductase [Pseudomonadales bacterium]
MNIDICDRLSIEKPILQAGMAEISRAELASAVTKAGGLGTIGLTNPSRFEADILETKESTSDGTFAANLLMPFVQQAHVDICLRQRVPVVTVFFGIDSAMIAKLKSAGTKVLIQIGTVEGAQEADQAGADGLIVQGFEAGGHIHGNERLDEIVPLIRSQFPNLPLIAAGGIWNQESAASCYDLGANGVSCGTRFLLSEESYAHSAYKQRLLEANKTVVTRLFGVGWPDKHRVVPNAAIRRWCNAEGKEPNWLRPVQQLTTMLARSNIDSRKFMNTQSANTPFFTPAPLRQGMDPDSVEVTALYAGECIAHINKLEPAAHIVEQLTTS